MCINKRSRFTHGIPKQILVPFVNVKRNRVRFSPRASASSQRSGRNVNGSRKVSGWWFRIQGFAPMVVLEDDQ